MKIDQEELNSYHVANPQPGDYWHDMFVGVCVIVERKGKHVILCRKTKEVDRDHWAWDLDQIEMMTIFDFEKWLSYGTIPGCWCDVCPEHHKWVLAEI